MSPASEKQDDSPGFLRLAPGVQLPASALRFTFSGAGGPGGQNVNKLATKAQLRVSMAALQAVLGAEAAARLRTLAGARLVGDDELLLQCDESRSQRMNRDTCVRRLVELAQQSLRRPRVRRATRPSRAAKQRRLQAKQKRGDIKRSRRTPPES